MEKINPRKAEFVAKRNKIMAAQDLEELKLAILEALGLSE